MPIPAPDTPSNLRAAANDANRRGIFLHGEGRTDEAVAAFREGISLQPALVELHTNLGTALMRLGRFDEARETYDRVLQLKPGDMRAHLAMYELEQIAGNSSAAVEHQARVLQRQTLFSERAPQEARRILVLMAPGDWQANVPIDFLVDRRTTTTHKLYVLSADQVAATRIPPADVVVTGIAESDANTERLRLAETIVEKLGLPIVNAPRRVLGTNRVQVWQTLHTVPNVVVPQTLRMNREALERGEPRLPFPIVVRPVGSHAGHDLARIEDAEQLRQYVHRVQSEAFFVMPFVDFSKVDGYYRKYRIIVVDGVPYAYHLAISPRWMIHYYNAPMRENVWMRDEEAHFLAQFEDVFGPELQSALRTIASSLQLEYFGIDCSIDRQGHLVLFEADPAMIVHAGDDPAMFGYKIPAARRIFNAFERMIDRVRSN